MNYSLLNSPLGCVNLSSENNSGTSLTNTTTRFMMEFETSLILVLLTGFTLGSCQKGDYEKYLETAMDMIRKAKDNIPTCVEDNIHVDHNLGPNSQTNATQKAVDCADLLQMGYTASGVYEIWPMNRVTEGKTLKVFCDMETDRGGWTVIQRRGDFDKANDYFDKNWKDYKRGFKTRLEEDFWLGNDNLFALTNQKLYSMRVDLKDFNQEQKYAVYDEFWIDDENHKYTLHISNYSGNAGNGMGDFNNKIFFTTDQDNTFNSYCAKRHTGGWWYHKCLSTNLNGVYYRREIWDYQKHEIHEIHGVFWQNKSLAWTEIKIRPKNFL